MSASSLPYVFARTQGVMVLESTESHVELLARDDASPTALAEVRRMLGLPVKLTRVPRSTFETRLADAYGQGDGDASSVVDDVGQDIDVSQMMQDIPVIEDLLETQDDAPIIRMINALLQQAVRQQASDIHIEPYERHCLVRFRRDGTLMDVARPHRALQAAMASRIKIMAQLDIAEKRLPQDGRISLRLAGRTVDVRVSTVPTAHGERIVLRILDKSASQLGLEAIGMAEDTQVEFREILAQPHGIVLVTGPTGSGKTTTLYAALREITGPTRNIVTVEDPVEYELSGVGQIQVNPRIDLSFARALRSVLRQDPDVIMIGEIRDLETAQIAVQASLTGHLVLATLHTNDSAAAITRLIDMGVEPFLLASSVRGVMAQRLVRCLCKNCLVHHITTDAERSVLGKDAPARLWTAPGCPACGRTGYSGRIGIYELLTLDPQLSQLIHDGAPEAKIRTHAQSSGLRLLRDDGMRYLASGVTSVEELLRVARD